MEQPKLLDRVRAAIRTRHFSVRTGKRHVSASRQNQALGALLFLYREVLQEPLPWMDGLVRAQRPMRLPVVLTPGEVRLVLEQMHDPARLVAQLLYGSGLRLLEALSLRVKDLDFGMRQIFIRDPKGRRDRTTMLPRAATAGLREQLDRAHAVHEKDLQQGFGRVWLPNALRVKLPNAEREWIWQWVFPATPR